MTGDIGLTEEDWERIREYLKKPPHFRSDHDLVPDESDLTD